MTVTADIVVIGGGVLGCSTALHLLEAGAEDVVVLERRDSVAAATSSAGAGFVAIWAGGHVTGWGAEEIALERYGLEFYRALSDEGHEFDYQPTGNLWIALDRDAAERELSRFIESEVVEGKQVLEPDGVSELAEVIRSSEVTLGVYHPEGINLSAPMATEAIASKFRALGGRLELSSAAESVQARDGRVVGVETADGVIATSTVVVAAGAWTNDVLLPLGVWAPHAPLAVSRITSQPLDVPSMPTIIFVGFPLWFRAHHGRLLWGGHYGAPPRYDYLESVPASFDAFSDEGVVEVTRTARSLHSAMPILTRARVEAVAHGLPCYTADGRHIAGRVPQIDGLYVVGGDNETGITHGPGLGRLVAEDVLAVPHPRFEREAFAFDRFGDSVTTPRDIVNAPALVQMSSR